MNDPEWRTITLRPVLKEVSDLWKQAVQLVSVDMGVAGTPHPSATAIAEKIALIVIQHYECTVNDAYLRDARAGVMRCWHPALPIEPTAVVLTIPHTGRLIRVCGSYAHLESHHSVPRSLGGANSERIWLCSTHHRHISDSVGGRDWRWLRAELGYTEDV